MLDAFRTAADDAIAKLQAEAERCALPLEGMNDAIRVAGESEAGMREAAQTRARFYQGRIALCGAIAKGIADALVGIDALQAQGEVPPKLSVSAEVFAEFKANRDSMSAAFADIETVGPDAVAGEATITQVVPA